MNRKHRREKEREQRRLAKKGIVDMENHEFDTTAPGYWTAGTYQKPSSSSSELKEEKIPGINCKPQDPAFVEKVSHNIWHDRSELDQFIDTIKKQSVEDDYEWSWAYNHSCKYVDIRVDMRDGGFIVMDKEGRRIDLATLKWQYKSLEEHKSETDNRGLQGTESLD